MNAVIETLESIGTVVEGHAVRAVLPSGTGYTSQSLAPASLPLRQARQRWASSLCDTDLHCPLQILEVDLIPQLLNGYSPARHAPDARITTG